MKNRLSRVCDSLFCFSECLLHHDGEAHHTKVSYVHAHRPIGCIAAAVLGRDHIDDQVHCFAYADGVREIIGFHRMDSVAIHKEIIHIIFIPVPLPIVSNPPDCVEFRAARHRCAVGGYDTHNLAGIGPIAGCSKCGGGGHRRRGARESEDHGSCGRGLRCAGRASWCNGGSSSQGRYGTGGLREGSVGGLRNQSANCVWIDRWDDRGRAAWHTCHDCHQRHKPEQILCFTGCHDSFCLCIP